MEKSTKSNPLRIHLCGYGFEDPSNFGGRPHFHCFCQMNLVCGGEGYFSTPQGEYPLRAGDVVFVPPGARHLLRLEKNSGFCDYSFKFFLEENAIQIPECTVCSEPELRKQQLVWINALGEVFKSIAPPELIRHPVEFPLSSGTPGVELLEGLLYGFCRRICDSGNSRDSWILRKIKLFVQSRKGKPVTVSECAEHLNCSAGHLLTTLRRETGFSTKEIIDRERIAIAKQLLVWSDLSITGLAAQMQFGDLIYFERFFRKYTGETPGNFRKRSKNR